MKRANLRQYVALRTSLLREKSDLEKRLQQINEALEAEGSSPSDAEGPRPVTRTRKKAKARARNKISLPQAVRQVTAKKALTKSEILEAVAALGYEFSSSNPVNSLNAVLYSKKQFKNNKGKFRPA